jgi:hypothetical protein
MQASSEVLPALAPPITATDWGRSVPTLEKIRRRTWCCP